ncbi:hypothetical protein CF166_21250 [Amycolatopsis sp. KNN50.9b]|nr:hypothetical protein CF166_21250 [Amycolatopsis sp. KNN50.9b]
MARRIYVSPALDAGGPQGAVRGLDPPVRRGARLEWQRRFRQRAHCRLKIPPTCDAGRIAERMAVHPNRIGAVTRVSGQGVLALSGS